MEIHQKTCLIISFGPVPTPKYQKIEGGGMRCWGLALGLKSKGYDVTVGVNKSFPLDTNEVDGIHLVNWQEDERFKELINLYDTVLVNYSMGGPMSFIVDAISDHTTLVLDCYVPIYIEVSARNSADKVTEYSNYSHDILHYNKALKRGDYFLCANIPQKHLYTGALSALGVINPYSYKKDRILLVPFGVESSLSIDNPHNPYLNLGIKKDDFVLLWFGGLYPWFNIKPLLNTVKKLSSENTDFKFVIVGGKNPYNSHPDFIKQYETTYAFITNEKLLNKSVYFVDWVDFADRINWYQNAEAVISINNVGDENIYSWRTRVMDYVWGEIPMLTNGGDPLSESLIQSGAAILLKDTDESTLYSSISKIINQPSVIATARKELLKQKEIYHWENVVQPLDNKLTLGENPYLDEKLFIQEHKPDTIELIENGGIRHKIKKVVRIPRKVLSIVRRKGLKRSIGVIVATSRNRLKKAVRLKRKYYFFSHPIDHTGAPLVLIDILHDYLDHVDKKFVDLVYPGGEKDLLSSIHKLGIITDKMVMGVGSRVIQAQLGIKKNDFVLLNTVAIYPNYRDYIFGLLERGKLNKATWFIHEDVPEIRFDDKGLVKRIKRLVSKGLLVIIVPSQQTAREYNRFFDTDRIKPVTIRVSVPKQYAVARKASDFTKTLKFIISGTPSDGRKGQLLAISAFSKFFNDYYIKDKKQYRKFELHLISIGKDDYISKQIRSIGTGLLKDQITFYPRVTKQKAMDITAKCNVTICSSLNETFALFVAEGMMMGHVLLRNKTSGYNEQITDQKNGYIIDHLDIDDFSKKIEHILNKDNRTSTLVDMSVASQTMARKFTTSHYFTQIGK